MKLYYRETGTGNREVIIVHGLYGASDNWLSVASALSDKYRILLPDQRNHGRSAHSEEHNYDVLVKDLYELIKTETKGKVILIGHSMGGKTVMRLALEHPEVVEHLVVVDIAPKNYGTFTNYAEVTNDHLRILKTLKALKPETMGSRKEMDDALKPVFPAKQLRQFLLKNVKRNSNGTYYWQLNIDALINHLPEIMDGFSQLDEKTKFNAAPVLFIKGEKSPYIKQEDTMPILRYFPQAQIVTIPNAGHWVHAEQKDLFLKTLTYFLED
ncbi:alpha/beta fold hydrolase [Geofilum sp. OHC36d9]|uniref:alpha/beta fold hydrolase n=1 Tax=Geofilum sp. OHC36d9 TaxID=3458413 RepID=UPI004033C4FD